jgi:hypothetical protein
VIISVIRGVFAFYAVSFDFVHRIDYATLGGTPAIQILLHFPHFPLVLPAGNVYKNYRLSFPVKYYSDEEFMATVLRPMDIGELLDRSFFIYRKHFIVFTAIIALPYLATLVFSLARIVLAQVDIQLSVSVIGGLLFTLALTVISLITLSIGQAATVIAVSNVHLERPISIGNAYAGIKGYLLEIIFVLIFAGIGIFFGLILLVIPGIIIALAWSLALPVTVIEKEGPLDALRRSAQLTRGNRSRILVILLLVFIVRAIIVTIFQAPFLFIGFSSIRNHAPIASWISVLNLIGGYLGTILSVPISTIATSLIYYDLRVRKEGFDLQFMMSSLKASSQTPPGSQAIS